ncbi:ROK family protein [Deinococcus lacus]|uniref:ROK family protein n=1 Tax=Deinococcus lacus TaxID=392561 RepID=A0ABW1YG50_9DEIO
MNTRGQLALPFPASCRGRTLSAANVDKAWIGAEARALFEEATGQPCWVLNDADAAGLAESRFGAARDYSETALLVTLGTGIGSALLYGGQLVPNTELGHLWLPNGKHAESWAAARVREEKSWAGRSGPGGSSSTLST